MAFEGDDAEVDNPINDNYYNSDQHAQVLQNAMNGNGNEINIPSDSVINMHNGRVKNKNKKSKEKDVEKIPLDDMDETAAYAENEQKHSDKTENGQHTNGHRNSIPVSSENLTQNKQNNSVEKSYKEYFIPVTTHKKFLR